MGCMAHSNPQRDTEKLFPGWTGTRVMAQFETMKVDFQH